MALKSFFSEEMIKSASNELSMETIAAKLTYFHEQLHLLHWQTSSYAEHMALGSLYDYVHDFKDSVIEKIMGYSGRKIKAFKVDPVSDTLSANLVVSELVSFAHDLVGWAEGLNYEDISNLAQSLSGEAAKTKYLLTLS